MGVQNVKILIVEDSPAVRAVMGMTLRMSNISNLKLLEAQDGLEGLRILKRKPVDVVFTDISMPRMDGLEMIDKMREDASLSDIPTVVVTYRDGSTDESELEKRKVRYVLNKPFKPKEVFAVLSEILNSSFYSRAPSGVS